MHLRKLLRRWLQSARMISSWFLKFRGGIPTTIFRSPDVLSETPDKSIIRQWSRHELGNSAHDTTRARCPSFLCQQVTRMDLSWRFFIFFNTKLYCNYEIISWIYRISKLNPFRLPSRLLTQNHANTLECARTRRRSSKRSEPAMPWRTGLTGSADRSDRCGAENREDIETRAREGPRRSLRG